MRRLNETPPLCTCTRTRCVITTISLVLLFAFTVVAAFRLVFVGLIPILRGEMGQFIFLGAK